MKREKLHFSLRSMPALGLLGLLVGAAPASGARLELTVDEPAGLARPDWPVTWGVPLPRGECANIEQLRLLDSRGAEIPLQAEALAYWPDRSIKWVLLDFQTDLAASQGAKLKLEYGPGARRTAPAEKIIAETTAAGVMVNTGPLKFEVNSAGSGFLDRVWLDVNQDGRFGADELLVDSGGDRRSVFDVVRSDLYQTGDGWIGGDLDRSKVTIDRVALERSGPLRAVVLVSGRYLNRVPSPFTLRIEAYAGKTLLHVQHTFTWTLYADREFLYRAGLSFPLKLGEPGAASFPGDGRVVSLPAGRSPSGSGLIQVDADYHRIWSARPIDGQRGAEIIDPSFAVYRTHSLPPYADSLVAEGGRSVGWGDLSDGRWGATIAMRNFWQEFPKEVAVDGASRLAAWFWSPRAAPLDLRRYSVWNYPHFGECCLSLEQGDLVARGNACGVAKTQSLVIDFHPGGLDPRRADLVARAFQDRPAVFASPEYYAGVGIIGSMAPENAGSYPKIESIFRDFADYYLFHRIDQKWYGMIDYGDIGHRTNPPFRTGPDEPYRFRDGWSYDEGRWGWTNTEGLDGLAYFLSYLRTGGRKYLDAGMANCSHVQDVDIFHASHLKYHGHTRHNVNHWGDGDTEIRISQPSVERFHYYLTGDPRTRDVITAVVDSLYLDWTIGHTAALGAVTYGLLVRWEMTGDKMYADRFKRVIDGFHRYLSPEGGLSHSLSIPVNPARPLPNPDPSKSDYAGFFLHSFGFMQAAAEFYELEPYEPLWDLLYRHAGYCVKVGTQNRSQFHLILLAYMAGKTKEERFVKAMLEHARDAGALGGVIPPNRAHWKGDWPDDPEVHDSFTSRACFCWNAIPYIIRALELNGVKESDIKPAPGTWVGSRADT